MSWDNTPPSPIAVPSASFDSGAPAAATPPSASFDSGAPSAKAVDSAGFDIIADPEEFEAAGLIGGNLKAVDVETGEVDGSYTIDDNAAIDSAYELDISVNQAISPPADPADWRIFITTPNGHRYEGTIADLPVGDAITVTVTKHLPSQNDPASATFDSSAPGAVSVPSGGFDSAPPAALTPPISV